MKTKIVILTFTLLLLGFVNSSFSYDHVRYVDVMNGDDANLGTSPGTGAWENLFYAIWQINGDDSILAGETTVLYVAPGAYYASAAVGLPSDNNIEILKNDLTIMGADSATTILDGTGADSAYWNDGIVVGSGTTNCTIKNLTITNFSESFRAGIRFNSGTGCRVENCEIDGQYYGIYIDGVSAEVSPAIYGNTIMSGTYGIYLNAQATLVSPEIKGNSISQNSSAGIYISTGSGESHPVIRENTIFNNMDGINLSFGSAPSSPKIASNRIYDNQNGIQVLGIGMMVTSQPEIINNIIYRDTGIMTNGIVLNAMSTDSVIDATIYHNTIDGGTENGISSTGGSGTVTAEIKYCIITNFSGGDTPYGINNGVGSTLSIDYVDVWNNTSGNFLGCNVTTTNYDADPQYTDAAAGDFSIAITSPCIDGVPLSEADPVNDDIIGTSRPRATSGAGTRLHDVGAYEYPFKSYAFSMPGGTGLSTDYRLMTLPLDLGSTSLTTLLTDAYGPYDSTNWRAFVWDGTTYAEFGTASFDVLTYNTAMASHAGRSFWLISRSGSLPSDTHTFEGILTGNMQPATIPLLPGWNLIALPWPASTENPSIELGNVVVKDGDNQFWLTSVENTITDPCVWDYNGVSGYTKRELPIDQLVPERGYWINVTGGSSVELIVPPDNGSHLTALKKALPKARSFKASKEFASPPSPPGSNLSTEGGNGCFIEACF